MPLSQFGIILPGLNDRSPIFSSPASGNSMQPNGHLQGQNGGYSSYSDPRSQYAGAGSTLSGGSSAAYSSPYNTGATGGSGNLYGGARFNGSGQDSDPTMMPPSSGLYTSSPSSGQGNYSSFNNTNNGYRSTQANNVTLAGPDARTQQQQQQGVNRSGQYQQGSSQQNMARVPSLPSYEGGQMRPLLPTGYASSIPTIQSVAPTGYSTGPALQSWPTMVPPQQQDPNLRPSSANSSSQQQQASRYFGSSAPTRSVHVRDSYTQPISASMEYYNPAQDPAYSSQHQPQYVSPQHYGGQLPSTTNGAAGGSFTDASPMINPAGLTANGGGYHGWASNSALSSSAPTASPAGHHMLPTPMSDGADESGSVPPRRHSAFDDDDARWEGVANRSHHADRYYLYGALTTHIYCRPSCASKRPTRDRVQFFPHPNAAAAAEAAGFRSCRRCKPDRTGAGDQTVIAVGECVRHMMMAAANSAEEGGEPKKKTLKEYAARAGLSTFHFHRSLAKIMSITPGEFSKACQSLALQDALGMDNAPPGPSRISSRMYDAALAGWSSRRAKRALGNIEPSAYASGDPGCPIVRTSVRGTEWGNVSMVYTAPATPGVMTISGQRYPPKPEIGGYHNQQHAAQGAQGGDRTSLSPPTAHGQSTNGDRVLLALIIAPDAEARLTKRFPTAVPADVTAQEEVRQLVIALVDSAIREEQLPPETVPSIRRARLWAAVRLRLTASGEGPDRKGSGSSSGLNNAGGSGDPRLVSANRQGLLSPGQHQMLPIPLDGSSANNGGSGALPPPSQLGSRRDSLFPSSSSSSSSINPPGGRNDGAGAGAGGAFASQAQRQSFLGAGSGSESDEAAGAGAYL